MSTVAPVRLVCPDCHRENEPERIYCHDCGTRLDHSVLGPQNNQAAEALEETQKRVAYLFDRRRGRTRALLLKWLKLMAAAAAAAVILLMLLAPSLPPVKKSEALPPQISLDLEGLTEYHKPPVLRYSEDAVNAYMNYVLGKKRELNHPFLDFERAVFAFRPDICQLTIGRSIFGYTVYTSGSYNVQTEGGKVNVAPVSGAIGRLPVHPVLMRYAGFLFSDVIRALQREGKLLAKVGGIAIGEQQIAISAR
ncbi:MAG: zinc ribbon domain-containing protein [Verrucomicrobia bacterium]|nr:zinc ribbon domain-containing protein [Verrucomicrobiota bacterium]